MEQRKRRILLQDIRPPAKSGEGEDVEWLCRSLNLFTKKDADKSAYRVFRILLKSSLKGSPKTSTEIADELDLARGTVLFHMKKFYDAGLVDHAPGRRYSLREASLEETIGEMMRDTERILDRMRRIAAEIDKEMGFEKRW
jgi:Mn-dependent DtxR family transcriptional regulator